MGNLLLFMLVGAVLGTLPYIFESIPLGEDEETRRQGSPFRVKLPVVERGPDGRLYLDPTFLGGAFIGAVISYSLYTIGMSLESIPLVLLEILNIPSTTGGSKAMDWLKRIWLAGDKDPLTTRSTLFGGPDTGAQPTKDSAVSNT